MAKVKIFLDPVSNTMNVWWGDPADVVSSEEVDDPHRNDVLLKDKDGNTIGVELIGVFPKDLNISQLTKQLAGREITDPFILQS